MNLILGKNEEVYVTSEIGQEIIIASGENVFHIETHESLKDNMLIQIIKYKDEISILHFPSKDACSTFKDRFYDDWELLYSSKELL